MMRLASAEEERRRSGFRGWKCTVKTQSSWPGRRAEKVTV
jgi:hypothetical protein